MKIVEHSCAYDQTKSLKQDQSKTAFKCFKISFWGIDGRHNVLQN